MDSENDEIELSYQIASTLYPFLKQHENLIMIIQNASLFVSPLKSFLFFFLLNLFLLGLYLCHFSLFSYMCIFVSLRTIPLIYWQKIFKFISKYFTFSKEKEKYFIAKPLPIDHISCLLAIFNVQLINFGKYVVYSIQKSKLFDTAYLTILHFFIFYLIYVLGDAKFLWILIHFILLAPIILAKRIGFELFHFPMKIEETILERLKKKISEEERIRREEEERIRAQEALKADEEVRRLAQIAISSEEIVKVDDKNKSNNNNDEEKLDNNNNDDKEKEKSNSDDFK